MLRPTKDATKVTLAGREGVKAKKLLGGLRYLWRSTPRSSDPRLQDLKDMLAPSPRLPQRVPVSFMIY